MLWMNLLPQRPSLQSQPPLRTATDRIARTLARISDKFTKFSPTRCSDPDSSVSSTEVRPFFLEKKLDDSGLASCSKICSRCSPQDKPAGRHQSDRQASLPDQTGGSAQERGVDPAEPVASGCRQPGTHVWDERAHLRRHGEAERWHARDDPVQREGSPVGAHHQIPRNSGESIRTKPAHSGRN